MIGAYRGACHSIIFLQRRRLKSTRVTPDRETARLPEAFDCSDSRARSRHDHNGVTLA